MDYLRLIWIVDYSGPRGAAWPRVSISEPLAFTSTSSLLLPLPRSQPALPNLSAATHTLSHPSASTDLFVLPASPPRVAHHPSRAAPSRRSWSAPTWLGLRPITCLSVIRCCANPAFQIDSLSSRRFETYEISLPILHPRYR